MAEYKTPCIHVAEISPLPTIQGVETSTAGFVGTSTLGPVPEDAESNAALVLVQSFDEYVETFGPPPVDDGPGYQLGHAVRGFFENGGQRVYVSRVMRPNDEDIALGIETLAASADIRILAAPGHTSPAVQNALIAQCEKLGDRFAILDSPAPGDGAFVGLVLAHRQLFDTPYAALYAPWLGTSLDDAAPLVAPSGSMAGIYARVDRARGVFKPPVNEVVRGAAGLSVHVSTTDQESLNPEGVNVIREFPGKGIVVWGGRTLSLDPEWKYVNVRRYSTYLEQSIEQGTQFAVFEPNADPTWERVRQVVTNFLLAEWRSGAMVGAKPEEAFFVRCDRTTMTQDDIDNGRLILQVGFALVRPAEFVQFRIGHFVTAAP